jgi:hypothetical protein
MTALGFLCIRSDISLYSKKTAVSIVNTGPLITLAKMDGFDVVGRLPF